jgi:hypothetical protein
MTEPLEMALNGFQNVYIEVLDLVDKTDFQGMMELLQFHSDEVGENAQYFLKLSGQRIN